MARRRPTFLAIDDHRRRPLSTRRSHLLDVVHDPILPVPLTLWPSPPAKQPPPPYLVHVGGCTRREGPHSSPLCRQPQLRLGRQRGRPQGAFESPARLRPHSPPPPSLSSCSIPPPTYPPHDLFTRKPCLASTSLHVLALQHQLPRR